MSTRSSGRHVKPPNKLGDWETVPNQSKKDKRAARILAHKEATLAQQEATVEKTKAEVHKLKSAPCSRSGSPKLRPPAPQSVPVCNKFANAQVEDDPIFVTHRCRNYHSD